MIEITYSIPLWSKEYVAFTRAILDAFEAKTRIHVDLMEVPAATERAELNHIALYHHGPDVTHLGTTWVRDMIAMQSLRPFETGDLRCLGDTSEFIPGALLSCQLGSDPTMWAFPFFVEASIINYRKDWFARARINSADAFASLAALNDTADRLARCGLDVPVELSAPNRWYLLHALSGWIWSAGYDYCTEDGKQVTIDRPKVMQLVSDYLRLLRAMSPSGRKLFEEKTEDLFTQGKSGVCMYAYKRRASGGIPAKVLENWLAAPYPGKGMIGGQHLVIWKHAHHPEACLELIQYLTSPMIQKRYLQEQNQFPARVEVYEHADLQRDPVFDAQVEALRRGRPYPNISLWGMIEGRLLYTLSKLQADLLKDPARDVDETVRQALEPLAKRLNLTLGG